jgi:Flp pilus assembly protein TadG
MNAKSQRSHGQALIEFALILPLVFVLIVNAVNFGGFVFAWITVASAARTGANYWILGHASAGARGQPSTTQVSNVITQEVSSLLNRSSLVVKVCHNFNGTTDCTGTVPSDPEPTHFAIGVVDVTYTYKPLIPTFSFPGVGVSSGFFPTGGTNVHRRAVMRIMN